MQSKCRSVPDVEVVVACSLQVKRRLHIRKFHKHGRYSNLKSKLYFSPKGERVEFRGAIVGMKGPDKDIRSWAAPEDVKEPDDR